jgi:malate synthase
VGVEITGELKPEFAAVLTHDALEFIADLHRSFDARRQTLLARRTEVQATIDAGTLPDMLPETEEIRRGEWKIPDAPEDLQRRWVEITGPVDRKMMINALNSGADVFMADFEDANSPTWESVVQGQINLCDAVDRTITFSNPDGKRYDLNHEIATLLVRPRGWHLDEKHLRVDGKHVSASLFDFALYFFHNARPLMHRGSGPYFYLPKLENHREAGLWNDVFVHAQRQLDLPPGKIKATVLIENILASFEMHEILHALGDHAAGLNAGRWDYIFSVISKFRKQPGFLLPDRAQITMTVPFMRAYTELMVRTCHRRGAHAIGGMAAFIPNRRDPEVTERALRMVREDKERESGDGCDGTWVAHPDLVPVAREPFARVLGDRPHQKDRQREDVQVSPADLLAFDIRGGVITESGLRLNISVAIQYMESWLRGTGAKAIYNLMEDTATAEISRAQVWQWIHSERGVLLDGRDISTGLVRKMIPEECDKIRQLVGKDQFDAGRYDLAARLFDELVTENEFTDFLTLKAYDHLD